MKRFLPIFFILAAIFCAVLVTATPIAAAPAAAIAVHDYGGFIAATPAHVGYSNLLTSSSISNVSPAHDCVLAAGSNHLQFVSMSVYGAIVVRPITQGGVSFWLLGSFITASENISMTDLILATACLDALGVPGLLTPNLASQNRISLILISCVPSTTRSQVLGEFSAITFGVGNKDTDYVVAGIAPYIIGNSLMLVV